MRRILTLRWRRDNCGGLDAPAWPFCSSRPLRPASIFRAYLEDGRALSGTKREPSQNRGIYTMALFTEIEPFQRRLDLPKKVMP